MDSTVITVTNINNKTLTEIAKMDSASFADFTRNINRNDKKADVPMTRETFKKYMDSTLTLTGVTLGKRRYKSRAEYDSALSKGQIKNNWLMRQINYKMLDINAKYNNDTRKILDAFKFTLLHSLPQMLFISLPLLALLLKLLYFRRKEFYYVNHAIFSIHLYIFIFIAMLFLFGMSRLNDQLNWGWITFLKTAIILSLFFYEYKAMRNFYQQGRGKTILKYLLLNGMFLIVIFVLFTVFLFFSFFKI